MATNSPAIPPCVTAHPCWRCKAATTRFAFCDKCGAAIRALAARQPEVEVDEDGYEIEVEATECDSNDSGDDWAVPDYRGMWDTHLMGRR